MCGIAGIVRSRGVSDPVLVERMRDAMAHRGPDDAGLFRSSDGAATLGHRRLAVIDLSPGGHQPMTDASGTCHVVFNGEIYNYRELRHDLCRLGRTFRTASDTEVLIEAYRQWGTDCVARLNGMFAFAIYDEAARRLFMARDRAGEKPLFYRHDGGLCAFASELKGLLADPSCPRAVDRSALDAYLAYGYVPFDRCMLRDVRKLPPAHALVYDVDSDALRTWAYWTVPPVSSNASFDEQTLIDRLEETLLDSVRLRLIADVPVGILLSGGIDSSLVTAMAARVVPRVKTFTITFPGHGGYDEAPFARAVAQHFGTEHVEFAAEPASVDLLPALARQFDEPMADSSMVPTYIVSTLIRREATVALGGDGGDELFGGYPHHSWIQQQARWRRLIPSWLATRAQPLASRLLPTGLKGRNYILGLLRTQEQAIAQFNQFFDPERRRALLGPAVAAAESEWPERFKTSMAPPGQSALQQATMVDFRSYLPDDILVKVDRASMLCSLEVRAPWLDLRLIELAFCDTPDLLRGTAAERKVLPRRLAERVLPRTLDLTRKQGFSLPLDAWFRGAWGHFVRDVLDDPQSTTFDRREVRALLDAQERGRGNSQRLFALTMFELWRREYAVSFP